MLVLYFVLLAKAPTYLVGKELRAEPRNGFFSIPKRNEDGSLSLDYHCDETQSRIRALGRVRPDETKNRLAGCMETAAEAHDDDAIVVFKIVRFLDCFPWSWCVGVVRVPTFWCQVLSMDNINQNSSDQQNIRTTELRTIAFRIDTVEAFLIQCVLL
jgi:hypothetical protein